MKRIIHLVFLTFFLLNLTLSYHEPLASEQAISNSVNNVDRKKEHILRDKYRNPLETLSFFNIDQKMHILEILPGKGYYAEILGYFLKENGKLTVASFGDDHPVEYLRNMHNDFVDYFKKNEQNYGQINIVKFKKKNYLSDIKPGSIDLVLTFRNNHNWINNGTENEIYKAINKVLKKNGTLGVVQHRADNSEKRIIDTKSGYVMENFLIETIENNGFKLISKSEINKNSLDTKDHPKGVWTLPPTFRLKEVNKEKYMKIGESDRMTLKFIKN